MSLGDVIEEATRRQQTVVVYGRDGTDLDDLFVGRNVAVEYRDLPPGTPDEFVVVRGVDGFRGAVSRTTLEKFFSPPVRLYPNVDAVPERYREVVQLFDDTVFASLDRRLLIAVTRELENRAWQAGAGTLRVGFQSATAFHDQLPAYRRLAEETDLDVHVYFRRGATTVDVSDWPLTLHTEPAEEIGRYWFLAFDGGGDPDRAFALVAEEYEPGEYFGVWSREPRVVDTVVESLA
ncbi:DICT sensory domain-containing protein [Haloarchaeobius sp. HRN-SO-5]|uniref:DICT sensory domain-containing protein n=1 Tax=Haloarchaeobius sp. HRN-SO-5 TaxID=3446118 RepID=UPI003EC02B05